MNTRRRSRIQVVTPTAVSPSIVPPSVLLEPHALWNAYRRATASQQTESNAVAKLQFTTALQKLRLKLNRVAPLLRESTLSGVRLPQHGSAQGEGGGRLEAMFWRRQRLFNEGIARVINEGVSLRHSAAAAVWLRDEIRPFVSAWPTAGASHRGGVGTKVSVWLGKQAAISTFNFVFRRDLERVFAANRVLFTAAQACVSPTAHNGEALDAIAAELHALANDENAEGSRRLGFKEQARFGREAALALAALLLPGEGALETVYRSWRTLNDVESENEQQSHGALTVLLPDSSGSQTEALLASLRCQPGGWQAVSLKKKRSGPSAIEVAHTSLADLRKSIDTEWVAVISEQVTFSPRALNEFFEATSQFPDAQIFYSDHDERKEGGGFQRPFFKPGWSPDLYLETDYFGGVVFVRRELFQRWAQGVETLNHVAVYRAVLESHSRGVKIARIPRVLFHREPTLSSESLELVRVVEEHAASQSRAVEVTPTRHGRWVQWKVKGEPKVSIIIPFKDKPELLDQLLRSFAEHERYQNYELLLVSNNSKNKATFALLAGLDDPRIKVIEWNHPFNYQTINNVAAKQAKGELLLFLNNDITWEGPGVLEELIGHAQRAEIGAVGCNLLFPRGRLQHAGVALGIAGFAAHPFAGARPDAKWTAFGLPSWTRNYLAVTGACLMVRKSVFDEVGGFDENIVVSGGDVDLCLRIFDRGYRNVNTPHVNVVHHESATRAGTTIPDADAWRGYLSFHKWVRAGDPFYNPNLTLVSQDVMPRLDSRTGDELAVQLLVHELHSSRVLLSS